MTAARSEDARAQEAVVGHASVLRAVEGREVLDLRALRIEDLIGPNLFLSRVPEGAVILDTRDEEAFRAWHWPRAVLREYGELERDYRTLDRERTYVLLCPIGIRTAHLAERMQRDGFEAYSFLGGAQALRRYEARRSTDRAGRGRGGHTRDRPSDTTGDERP